MSGPKRRSPTTPVSPDEWRALDRVLEERAMRGPGGELLGHVDHDDPAPPRPDSDALCARCAGPVRVRGCRQANELARCRECGSLTAGRVAP